MITLLWLFLLAPAVRADLTPLPADTAEAVNKNFRDTQEEAKRLESLISTPTFTNPATFVASATFQGGVLISSAIIFNSSATFNAGVFGSLRASSFTTNGFGGTWTNTAYGACLTTVTIATSGQGVDVIFAGSLVNDTSGAVAMLSFLQDGAYISPLTGSKDLVAATMPNATSVQPASFVYTIAGVSAGSHSYCLLPRVGSNTGSFGSSIGKFGAREVP